MKKITWITINEWYSEIDILLINELKKKYNYEIDLITNNNNIYKFYKKEWINILNLWLENIKIKNNLDYFIDKYWFENPKKSLWQRELKIIWCNINYLEKSSLEYFHFFETFFESYDWVFFHNWDHYFHLITEKVAKFYWIKIVYHNSIWVFPNQIVFSDSWKYNDFWNEKYLNDEISSNDKENIENFINDKINKKPLIWWRRKILWIFHIFKLFFYIKNYIFIWKYRGDYRFPLILY